MKKVLGLVTFILILGFVAGTIYTAYLFFHGEIGPMASSPKVILRKFSIAARDFSASNRGHKFWETGTTSFEPYFSHHTCHSGYSYFYFSDDTLSDGLHKGSRFVYAAFPILSKGKRTAYFIDENQYLYCAADLDDTGIQLLAELAARGVNMELSAGAENPSRCRTNLFDFRLVSRVSE